MREEQLKLTGGWDWSLITRLDDTSQILTVEKNSEKPILGEPISFDSIRQKNEVSSIPQQTPVNKKSVQSTSKKQYKKIASCGDLGNWQKKVYNYFKQIGKPICDSELIDTYNIPERIKPRTRRYELVKYGFLRPVGKKTYRGILQIIWEVAKR